MKLQIKRYRTSVNYEFIFLARRAVIENQSISHSRKKYSPIIIFRARETENFWPSAAEKRGNYISKFQAATGISTLGFSHATRSCIYASQDIYMCVYIYIYVCVCIYMYMYIYICIHTCIYHIHLIIGFWSFHLEPFSCISRAASLGSPREKSIFRVHRYILTVSVSSVTVRKRLSSSSFPRDQIRICNSLKPFPLLQRNRYRKATTNLSSHRFAEY